MKTWIECTYSKDRKEFTQSLGAPLYRKGGSSYIFYDNVGKVMAGDKIYHLDLNTIEIVGYSFAKGNGFNTGSNYRAELHNFQEFNTPIYVPEVFKREYNILESYYLKNKSSSNKISIFYSPNGDEFRVTQGGYLTEFPNNLEKIIILEPHTIAEEDNVKEDEGVASKSVTITRKIRDTKMIKNLKDLHLNRCQICGLELYKDLDNKYSEGHHLYPLGENGPDTSDNILILCPNHHVEFDYGAIAINPDTFLIEHINSSNPYHTKEPFSLNKLHRINQDYLKYHYNKFKKRA